MIKRLSTAAIGVALVLSLKPAQAAPYFGFDGRTYGELAKAPNWGRPESKGPKLADAKGAPRKCLTPAVREVLDKIEARFGPVQVISTCRPGARIAGSGRISRHASGNAVDFEAGKRKGAIIDWLVANHKKGGTMTYPSMSHIHVDIGQHFVSLAGGRKYASRSRSSGSQYADASSNQGKKSSGKSGKYSHKVAYGGSYAGGYSGGYSSGNSYGGDGGMGHYTGGYATIYR